MSDIWLYSQELPTEDMNFKGKKKIDTRKGLFERVKGAK